MTEYTTLQVMIELRGDNIKVFKLIDENPISTKYLTTMTRKISNNTTLRCLRILNDNSQIISFNSTIPFNTDDVWIETSEINFVFENGKEY